MPQSVALVLSSGGARGYAHIGVIEALEKNGFTIRSVTGCSMGAVVGGVYAAGGLSQFKEWACSLERTDIFKMYDFVFSSQGFIRGERVFKQIEEFIPDRKIEELAIPFQAVATDLNAQKEIIFNKGSLYWALRASSTIPAVIRPVEFQDLELLDGGILNPLPINLALKQPGDIVVAVDVNSKIPYVKPKLSKLELTEEDRFNVRLEKLSKKWFKRGQYPKQKERKKLGFFDLMMKTIDMMQDRITENILQQHPPDILIEISRSRCGTFDYYKAAKLIDEGFSKCESALKAAKYKVDVEG